MCTMWRPNRAVGAEARRAVTRLTLAAALVALSCAACVTLAADPLTLIVLTGLDGEKVWINSTTVVRLIGPRRGGTGQMMAATARCAILTVDRRFISVIETCEEVSRLLGGR